MIDKHKLIGRVYQLSKELPGLMFECTKQEAEYIRWWLSR